VAWLWIAIGRQYIERCCDVNHVGALNQAKPVVVKSAKLHGTFLNEDPGLFWTPSAGV
jgi:hypothetical protein